MMNNFIGRHNRIVLPEKDEDGLQFVQTKGDETSKNLEGAQMVQDALKPRFKVEGDGRTFSCYHYRGLRGAHAKANRRGRRSKEVDCAVPRWNHHFRVV